MYLKNLSLINYKNFESSSFEFDPKINCLVGQNGIGKTNVLDSIYHLAYGKSYFNPITRQNIRHGADFFVVDGEFIKDERSEKIIVSVKKGRKKIIKRNGKTYERFRDHIGLIPVVIISPSDSDLISEGSDTRRKFMDGIISQSDPEYLQDLIHYNKVLAQRNALLKYFVANNTYNADNLLVYNEEMQRTGEPIHQKRKAFVEAFTPIFKQRYAHISQSREEVQLVYKSQLFDKSMDTLFEESLSRDRMVQYTTQGIHKDDLKLRIRNYPVKKFGSQGQQKSYLIALKLAQYDFIKKQLSTKPILLLDDIFDKLDEQRVAQLVEMVTQDDLGQLFISDTHRERTENVVKKSSESYKMITL